jgi:decaprenyl-phosphate phosphoribosyltransferase
MNNPYFQLMRINHWFKNLFIYFGIFASLWLTEVEISQEVLLSAMIVPFVSASLISSSNYIVNQIADARFDAKHPHKKKRPIPSGRISKVRAILLAIVLFYVSIVFASYHVSVLSLLMLVFLWIAGLVYNIPPIRLKDKLFIDVLSESFNNPIRFLVGWFSISPLLYPPISLVLLTWCAAAILMTGKRYDELVVLGKELVPYRKSFARYSKVILGRMMYVYTLFSVIFFTLFAIKTHQRFIFAVPFVSIFLIWIVRNIQSGGAQARDLESFMTHRKFVVYSSLLVGLFILLS